jgi:glycosyltransferase involved in cell wall biosynthesis
MGALARWDRATAGRVDLFVANSHYVAGRIRRYYNRRSIVVYPPVDTAFYRPGDDSRRSRSQFLVVSALVPYKRLDVAMEACRRARASLMIVGTGPGLAKLRAAAGPDVEFLGWRSDEEIRELYRQSTAVLMPGVEDFGMVPVEAQACGCPVVALGEGGAEETVIHGETGMLVSEASADAFADALDRVRSLTLDPAALRQHALRFSREQFLTGFQAAVEGAVADRSRASREAGNPSDHPAASRTRDEQAAASADPAASHTRAEPPAAASAEPAASHTRAEQPAAAEDEQ